MCVAQRATGDGVKDNSRRREKARRAPPKKSDTFLEVMRLEVTGLETMRQFHKKKKGETSPSRRNEQGLVAKEEGVSGGVEEAGSLRP